MNQRERFLNVMNFKPVDRLPMIEWAGWWDKTIARFISEGAPDLPVKEDIKHTYFGLDRLKQYWIGSRSREFSNLAADKRKITDMETYERLKPYLYDKSKVDAAVEDAAKYKKMHDDGELVVWITVDGFFWFPRTLFGIEDHLYAFYDNPELMHRMNQDNTHYIKYVFEKMSEAIHPDFMTFAEDMSYNLGPMLSEDMFDEFLLPYYKQTVPYIESLGTIPLVDTDGQLEGMIPWLQRAGIRGALPLERKAGVDVNRIRQNYPDFLVIGAYDKMVMDVSEEAMREEFERLLPTMKSGGYIPSVDHQTPPGVSLENYWKYLTLLKEYSIKGAIR
ncbi:MAG TPA: uroporphyrinogen decarboxylase family protein [Clostridia bacterium]|nr:MAG: methylcobalamin:coenzyme M methyltransferase [Firmicutes bacterium ADurb.Bin146]HOD93079.1 uroporphyrinogen decarboxylase family protein [Clostridia bacterium]HQM39402.1 uroporphyrinogen decarboxylase family protein [Clostridia bacterium]